MGVEPMGAAAMEQKILYGSLKPNTSREIIGGHSGPILLDTTGTFEAEVLSQNADETTLVKFIKQLGNGASKIKKSTLALSTWSDTKILDVTRLVSEMAIVMRSPDGRIMNHETRHG